MTEPAAARPITTAAAFAYPVVAHLAVARSSAKFTVAAIVLLAVIVLLRSLLRGRILAWAGVLIIIAGSWWLSRTSLRTMPLYIPPVLVPAFLAWVFGHTLLPGRTPLIEQIIRALHPPGTEPENDPWLYARKLTLAWTTFFLALASLNLGLAALAEPGGLLLATGIAPPITVPQEWWSLFANVIGYLLVAAFFLIEYAYRRRRFPQQPYRNMFDFFRRLLAAMPRLLGRATQ